MQQIMMDMIFYFQSVQDLVDVAIVVIQKPGKHHYNVKYTQVTKVIQQIRLIEMVIYLDLKEMHLILN
jgi:hypothetical protein